MKSAFPMVALVISVNVYGNDVRPISSDPCRVFALEAAEDDYGRDPRTTRVKTVVSGKEYRVAVGVGNEKAGEQDYYITFPEGCAAKPKVMQIENK